MVNCELDCYDSNNWWFIGDLLWISSNWCWCCVGDSGWIWCIDGVGINGGNWVSMVVISCVNCGNGDG